MGTRSAIAVKHGNNIKAVYCHYDGYLAHNGAILQKYYNSAKANFLVALGDISSLGTDIGEAHDFDRPDTLCKYDEDGFRSDTNFYGRDRGEECSGYRTFQNEQEFVDEMSYIGCEYFYIMDNDNWYVSTGKEFTLLSQAIELELAEQE
jgi:hypothetical protein